jgi:hypothetical protein
VSVDVKEEGWCLQVDESVNCRCFGCLYEKKMKVGGELVVVVGRTVVVVVVVVGNIPE